MVKELAFFDEYVASSTLTTSIISKLNRKLISLKAKEPFNSDPYCYFGLTCKTSYCLSEGLVPLILPDNVSARTPALKKNYRKFFLRPSPEPIRLSYAEITSVTDDLEIITELASCLVGRHLRPRQKSIQSNPNPNGDATTYIPHFEIKRAFEKRASRALQDITLEACFQRYLDFCIIHPFEDGNGRTARSLLLLDLSRLYQDARILYLPLGPIFMALSDYFMTGYQLLQTSSSADEIFIVLSHAIDAAIDIQRHFVADELCP